MTQYIVFVKGISPYPLYNGGVGDYINGFITRIYGNLITFSEFSMSLQPVVLWGGRPREIFKRQSID
jgi:hypothetical protein